MFELEDKNNKKIIVRVHEDGHVLLEDIFPGRDLSDIESYQIEVKNGQLTVKFYDKHNNLIRNLG